MKATDLINALAEQVFLRGDLEVGRVDDENWHTFRPVAGVRRLYEDHGLPVPEEFRR